MSYLACHNGWTNRDRWTSKVIRSGLAIQQQQKNPYDSYFTFSTAFEQDNITAMRLDGYWQSAFRPQQLTCTICSFRRQPMLFLKGVCATGSIDYVYFPENRFDKIVYRGYQEMEIVKIDNIWTFQKRLNPDNFSMPKLSSLPNEYPIGRKEWYFDNSSVTECLEIGQRNFSLSSCKIQNEFTCDNGLCIPIDKRCNQLLDCMDGSDENDCKFFKLPPSYSKEMPPIGETGTKALEIGIGINVLSVEDIDLNNNKIKILYSLRVSWSDFRITYYNVEPKKTLPTTALQDLWSPFEALHHINAVFGTLHEELNFQTLELRTNVSSYTLDEESAFEDYRYEGKNGILFQTRRLKALYDCHYDLFRFPFDQQICKIELELRFNDEYVLNVDPSNLAVNYDGKTRLNEFEIIGMSSFTNRRNLSMDFGFVITFDHLYEKQVVNLYFQQFFLWLVSYLTIYIDMNDFSNRFMGTVTALLVLSTLIDNMNSRLSSRANVRLIDIWNIWYILQIILIIVFHILVNRQLHLGIRKAGKNAGGKSWGPKKLNLLAKYFFPIFNGAFLIYYWIHNLVYKECNRIKL